MPKPPSGFPIPVRLEDVVYWPPERASRYHLAVNDNATKQHGDKVCHEDEPPILRVGQDSYGPVLCHTCDRTALAQWTGRDWVCNFCWEG